MLPQTQKLVVALMDASRRRESARILAKHLGADDLIIFVADPEIRVPLPAHGFPQTLPQGRVWRSFLAECVRAGRLSGELPFPDARTIVRATSAAAEDGSVLVLLGGEPSLRDVEEIALQLPLLGAAFRSERIAITAAGHVRAAREAAVQAKTLAEKLDAIRSELQQALVSAESATRAKDEFLAIVSHELRTPLSAILGWARMLRTRNLDDETTARALETIERNAKSQAQLIEDILDFSRVISGKLRLEVGPVDLADVIQSAVDVVAPAADAKGVRVQVFLDSGAGPVSGDPARLQQVMWNLLSNAIKFSPEGERVQVSLERIDSHVQITVTDTGQGISAEFLPHVFERFRQADNTATRRHGGLGLGLAITRHLVELHGGTISAQSAGEGQGAVFTIRLPLMIGHKTEDRTSLERARIYQEDEYALQLEDVPRLDGLRILVVDDEPDGRDLLTTVLTQSGAKVTTAATAADALEKLQQLKPDLLVSDIEMPGEDGYSLIRKVRSLKKSQGGRIPAIALTAHTKLSDRMRALSAGFQMHIPKPVEPAELIVVIANISKRA